MSTLKVSNVQHGSAASAAITLDANGQATLNGLAYPTSGSLSGRNRIINGDMRIDQRNAGAAVTPTNGSYTLDRWSGNVTQASKFTVQQNAGSVTPPAGFSNYLGVTSSSAYSVTSSDAFSIYQAIEGLNTSDLAWGTASASAVTLSFWVRSSLTGTFGGSLRNSTVNRCYPFSYTVSSVNTWELKTIAIPGDTSGTWLTTNDIGILLTFGLGVGSTFSGTAGSWSGSNFVSATGATSVVGTNGATFYITGVQLEAGSVATPFERRSYGQELALCQRYFETSFSPGGAAATTNTDATGIVTWGGSGGGSFNTTGYIGMASVPFCVVKRAAPTITSFDTASPRNTGKCERHYLGFAGTSNSNLIISNPGSKGFNAFSDTGASGAGIIFHYTASAEL